MEPTIEPTVQDSNSVSAQPLASVRSISVLRIAKDSLKKIFFHWKPILFLTIPAGLLCFAVWLISVLTYLKLVGTSINEVMQSLAMNLILYGSVQFSIAPENFKEATYFFIIFVLAICAIAYIVGRLTASVITILQSSDKKTIKAAFIEGGMNTSVLKIFGLTMLVSVVCSFCTMFFIIPGIYYALAFSLSIFYLVLEKQKISQALRSSLNNTQGIKLKLFVVIVMIILSSFVLGAIGSVLIQIISDVVKHVGSITVASIIELFGMLSVFMLTFVFPYAYALAVLSQVYSESKKFPTTTKSPRIWPIVLFAIFGFCIYIFMLVILPALTKDAISNAKEKAAMAEKMNQDLEKHLKDIDGDSSTNTGLSEYEQKLKELFSKDIVTIRPGHKSNGEVIGMGLDFNYPETWINLGPSDKGNVFMQFLRASQAFGTSSPIAGQPSKANDLFKGGVAFAYTYDTESKTMSGFDFLKLNAPEKLDREKNNGDILSYSITAYPGKPEVGVLESEWVQPSSRDKTKQVNVRERYYYWFVGPHRYTIHAVDDKADFLETDNAARLMINSLKFDQLILDYPKSDF